MPNTKLVVRPHQPKRLGVLWTLVVVVAVGVSFLMFKYGQYRGGYDQRVALQTEANLNQELAELSNINTTLRERIALLETGENIDREAYAKVETALGDLQAQIQQQQEELAFYRGIVAPQDGKRGLKIQRFEVTPAGAASEFRMRLVLVQAAAKQDRRISGVVTMSIEGARDGTFVTYDVADLISGTKADMSFGFSFRYFQNFERQLLLPNGFVPQRVNVEVNPKGSSADSIKQSFDWAVKSS